MRGLGLAGAGLGAAAATMPVFHDLDEVAAASTGNAKRPWYIKEREAFDPTTPVDWGVMKPHSPTTLNCYGAAYMNMSPEARAQLFTEAKEKNLQRLKNDTPGFGKREWALYKGFHYQSVKPLGPHMFMGIPQIQDLAQTPEKMGYPRWSGTPEQNSAMVRTVARWAGFSTVGFIPVNEKTKKLMFTNEFLGKRVLFENVDESYEAADKQVIPEKFKTAVVCTWRQSPPLTKIAPTHISSACGANTCLGVDGPATNMLGFFKGLGYPATTMGAGGYVPKPAFGVMAGLGELGRLKICLTPEFGALCRATSVFFTELPVVYTNPIDFGAREFCKSCAKCAETCPGQALQHEKEPSWDITPEDPNNSYLKPAAFNRPGIETWHVNHHKCAVAWKQDEGECNLCIGLCVFSKLNAASIHDVIKGTVASTTLLNGFFFNMDKAFGYGPPEGPEIANDFFNLGYKLPEYGVFQSRDAYGV